MTKREDVVGNRLADVTSACERSLSAVAKQGVEAIGIDVVDIADFSGQLNLGGRSFLESVFTPGEIEYAKGRSERLATRFAAKEAVAKVLGTGLREGVSLIDIEAETGRGGEVSIRLHGQAARRARERCIGRLLVSMSRDSGLAIAAAVGLNDGRPGVDNAANE